MPYWIEFKVGTPACVEAATKDEAIRIATELRGEVRVAHVIPYPREPRIGPRTSCPSLCFGKSECLGKTACPQRYSCTE